MTSLRTYRWNASEEPTSLWGRLNDAWRDLVVTFAGMPAQTLYDVPFAGPIATLTFTVANLSRPRGVLLIGLVRSDTNATSAVTFSWTFDGTANGGTISTTAFSGVAAATWRATFLVIGD